MSRPLIGQVLTQMGKLTPIDIDEILVEQAFSRRRFGEIALSWGLCETGDLCEAWCNQAGQADCVDLSKVDLDANAFSRLSAETMRQYAVVPLRLIGDVLVVACARPIDAAELPELVRSAGLDIRFVQADPAQIQAILDHVYPLPMLGAAA